MNLSIGLGEDGLLYVSDSDCDIPGPLLEHIRENKAKGKHIEFISPVGITLALGLPKSGKKRVILALNPTLDNTQIMESKHVPWVFCPDYDVENGELVLELQTLMCVTNQGFTFSGYAYVETKCQKGRYGRPRVSG